VTANMWTDDGGAGGGQKRKRLRGMITGRSGRTIGFTSLAAPIIGYVINDLRKPDSVVRELAGRVLRRLLPNRSESAPVIDITDKVEVLQSSNENVSGSADSDDSLRKEI